MLAQNGTRLARLRLISHHHDVDLDAPLQLSTENDYSHHFQAASNPAALKLFF